MSVTEDTICPSCTSRDLLFFYEVKNVPANNILFSNNNEAVSLPRGDIHLVFCKSCGFIFNLDFIPSKIDYSSPAPEEQGFSPTFNAFAQRLATHLIETHDLYGKHILEIGCGRGAFLALLCELGNNFGIGIDPSTITGKIRSPASNRLKFIRDFYSEYYTNLKADLICCRHTLEHIHNTAEFLNIVRHAANKEKNTAVFFEVPDVSRILIEATFWDINYEHCSYFNIGSLARLFRSCKFEVTNLQKEYFDQYLLIEAKPANRISERVYEIEDSVTATSQNVKMFSSRCQEKLEFWKSQMFRIRKEKKKAIIWGSGSKCISFMTTLAMKNEIEYIVDINPNRQGKFIPGVGKQIMPPEFLKVYKPDIVIVMNPVYCDEIKQMLNEMSLTAELIPCS